MPGKVLYLVITNFSSTPETLRASYSKQMSRIQRELKGNSPRLANCHIVPTHNPRNSALTLLEQYTFVLLLDLRSPRKPITFPSKLCSHFLSLKRRSVRFVQLPGVVCFLSPCIVPLFQSLSQPPNLIKLQPSQRPQYVNLVLRCFRFSNFWNCHVDTRTFNYGIPLLFARRGRESELQPTPDHYALSPRQGLCLLDRSRRHTQNIFRPRV